jgi:UDP-glucuronate decarboxylase
MRFDDGRVVSNFIYQALRNEPITIYGKGEQTRSFCYVDDLVKGLVSMMNTADTFYGPVNLGNPDEFTILELAHQVIAETGSSSHIVFEQMPQDDPKQRQPDISLARKELNFFPSVSLNEGLKLTISDFLDREVTHN